MAAIEFQYISFNGVLLIHQIKCILVMLLMMMMNMSLIVRSDVDKDREECGTQLVGLATCLPYVGGTAKSPTPDCCSGLKQILATSKKCLCVLVKDRNDPSLGLKINSTLALGLPSVCKAPANISECPSLLHLAPNSPDAKVFEEFGSSSKGTSTPTSPVIENPKSGSDSKTTGQVKNDGGKGKRKWLEMEMVAGVLLWCFTSLFIMDV
ncbi:Plant lipid transfer protein/Par allergen [Macleaya cordata]|uniref:Plant lipid transfer protein/Par allergen n=1 Tax=Macleaya cordata TaxID=56857 RepID=A0A200QKJ6_MACCD|nr:Plant lipid transfer protein/Par allergen [Macleaya cordata]